MGKLSHFDLNGYIHSYGLNHMIETGTYLGDSVAHAIQFNFEKIYSIELVEDFYEKSSNRFKYNEKVIILNNTSKDGLVKILTNYDVKNCLFWLDAHLPNFYKSEYSSDYKKDKDLLIPLEDELRTIIKNKNIMNDVFIIDDLRIYELGNFQKGNWTGAMDSGVTGIDFIYELLGNSHNINKSYDDEGYIICTPKTNIIEKYYDFNNYSVL
jgi:hypothetical protein